MKLSTIFPNLMNREKMSSLENSPRMLEMNKDNDFFLLCSQQDLEEEEGTKIGFL